jgi:hypothetical protein
MRANEKLVASDGYEVMLFPLEYMYMSQDEGGSYSHAGTLQIDFLGWGANGRIYQCPYYAPCSCRCVATTDLSAHNRIYQSLNPVHLADGTLSYVTWEVAHDNNPPTSVGSVLQQGDLMGYTGTAGNVSGDHLHFQTARGLYIGWEQVPPNNNWQLKNEMHIYDACYVNDTTIVEGYGHDWKTYDGPIGPTEKKKEKFPWVLYARKLRNKR